MRLAARSVKGSSRRRPSRRSRSALAAAPRSARPRRRLSVAWPTASSPPRRSPYDPGDVILENGVVRTMEPSLPLARGLAIAGDTVAGGVGAHETALPSPERVDLGGRCVLPGFTDSHVHFPTWAMAQHEVRLEDTATIDEALARIRDALSRVAPGHWLRGRGWRSGDWNPAVEPTKESLDELAGDTPVALMARDSHSVWLNSAALARANG